MSVRVVGIGTALPPYAYTQAEVKAIMRRWVGGERRVDRLLERVYAHSGIERRHSVVAGLRARRARWRRRRPLPRRDGGDLRAAQHRHAQRPLRRFAPPLLERAARRALAAAPAALRDRVSHVITVSCTGFQAPGVDDHLVRALGLAPDTERYHLGFMGCYAVFPALRMARAFCLADPEAVVLSPRSSCARSISTRAARSTASCRRRCSPTARPPPSSAPSTPTASAARGRPSNCSPRARR
jgi:predicted naringenin-chalcone synthase